MVDISAQIDVSGFTAVCPGRGYSYQYQGKERMMFPVYDNNLGTEYASVIYTEDEGKDLEAGATCTGDRFQGKRGAREIFRVPACGVA